MHGAEVGNALGGAFGDWNPGGCQSQCVVVFPDDLWRLTGGLHGELAEMQCGLFAQAGEELRVAGRGGLRCKGRIQEKQELDHL